MGAIRPFHLVTGNRDWLGCAQCSLVRKFEVADWTLGPRHALGAHRILVAHESGDVQPTCKCINRALNLFCLE